MRLIDKYLNTNEQLKIVSEIRAILASAPLFRPTMPGTGQPMSVRMSNCGELGWVADKSGYRYQSAHPNTGKPWPKIPDQLIQIWADLVNQQTLPQACLINYYEPTAKMGLHQDKDEDTFDYPVLSISLGDDCRFRLGGTKRKDPTKSMALTSGDIVILDGEDRLAFHGVDKIYPGTSTLLKAPGRINLTLRRVTLPS